MKGRKNDISVVLVIAAAAGIFFLTGRFLFQDQGQIYAEVYLDGELMKTVELNQEQQLFLPERPAVVLEVKNGGIAFIRSDCPDKVCIRSGYLSHTGQTASCLPNTMTVTIRSESPDVDEPDIVIGAGGVRGIYSLDMRDYNE